jgi:beta-glucosidase
LTVIQPSKGIGIHPNTSIESLVASFPREFMWGIATSAYQIEGGTTEDGRGESIWDVFARTPGNIEGGHDASVACDHYARRDDDVRLLHDLGVDSYRFSIAWPRIQPLGEGPVNEKGVAFYDRLIDLLLDAGIRPFPTLYHWDLPQALEDRGGWANRETADRFADYAAHVVRAIGDRIDAISLLPAGPLCPGPTQFARLRARGAHRQHGGCGGPACRQGGATDAGGRFGVRHGAM